MSPAPDFSIPSVEILEEIGRGSGSVVYRGRHGDENLAIKIQRDRDPEESVRLRREALAIARVRHAVSDLKITSDGERIPVTVSLGLAGDPNPESLNALMKTADTALYRAKESGRNRVVSQT